MIMKTVKMHWEMGITLTRLHLDQRAAMIRQVFTCDLFEKCFGQTRLDGKRKD